MHIMLTMLLFVLLSSLCPSLCVCRNAVEKHAPLHSSISVHLFAFSFGDVYSTASSICTSFTCFEFFFLHCHHDSHRSSRFIPASIVARKTRQNQTHANKVQTKQRQTMKGNTSEYCSNNINIHLHELLSFSTRLSLHSPCT